MSSTAATVLLAAPLALASVALIAIFEPGSKPRRVLLAARLTSLVLLAAAVATTIDVALRGAVTSPLLGFAGIGLSVRLDAVSVTMLTLVAFIGAIIVQFSRNYLDGDPRQGVFIGRLCLTLATVILMVVAGNLVQFVVFWIATSFALHGLLVFYPERRKAQIAARKKFIFARIGDVSIVIAAILLASAFATTDIATLLARAQTAAASGAIPDSVGIAALLIALAALLKSAQFPTHGWLVEVMETPTPVSALLHAGIINAGGFLVVRFADVMLLAPPSMLVLAIVGGFTALFASVVMMTQTNVKGALAWSTLAQMGFMLLESGLGLFALTMLHIVAHSLYKAHAFLSAGSVVENARASWVPSAARPGAARAVMALVVALTLYLAASWMFGVFNQPSVQALVLGSIFAMALAMYLAQAGIGGLSLGSALSMMLVAAVTTTAFVALHVGATEWLGVVLPSPPPVDPLSLTVMLIALALFGAVWVMQLVAPSRLESRRWRAARVHLANGLYVNAACDRLIGALALPSTKTVRNQP